MLHYLTLDRSLHLPPHQTKMLMTWLVVDSIMVIKAIKNSTYIQKTLDVKAIGHKK